MLMGARRERPLRWVTENGPCGPVLPSAPLLILDAVVFAVVIAIFLASCSSESRPDGRGSGYRMEVPTVITGTAKTEPFDMEIEAIGTAFANEAIEITSEDARRVHSLRFTEGHRVSKGQLLVELESAEVRADLAVAEAALVESRENFERSRCLYASRALSNAQLAQIEAQFKMNEARVASARTRVGYTQIRAPFDGRIGLRKVSPGSLVRPDTVITTLDDTSVIKVDFTIPQTFIEFLRPGLPMEVQAAGITGPPFRGRVTVVGSRVDPVTRTVTVRAEVPNEQDLLKPGMFLAVKLHAGTIQALVVPESALFAEQGKTFVFVVVGGEARRREVQIGRRRVGEIQITSGLAESDRVIVQGPDTLRDEMRVQEANSPLTSRRPAPSARA